MRRAAPKELQYNVVRFHTVITRFQVDVFMPPDTVESHHYSSTERRKHPDLYLKVLCGVFNWLRNSLSLIPMPLYDLRKQTRPTARRLAISISF